MSERLNDLQTRILSELAHMRVRPEDAILSTKRLQQLLGHHHLHGVLFRLEKRGLLERPAEDALSTDLWRITDAGREALAADE